MQTLFTTQLGISVPIICGAMYPCTNPELVAAVSEAGGVGVIQPISFTSVYALDLREAIRSIRSRTRKPIGINLLIEKTNERYLKRNKAWMQIALEEKIHFFVTSLGKPDWVVQLAHEHHARVYHDVTHAGWAEKAKSVGVDGLVCVNDRAGGHVGARSPKSLYEDLKRFELPLIAAGGVGSETSFIEMMNLGYDGVQMGTRFIATNECATHPDYKQAILRAKQEDVRVTDQYTGIPLSLIPPREGLPPEGYFTKLGRCLRRYRLTRYMARALLLRKAFRGMKQANQAGGSSVPWVAGQCVGEIHSIEPAGAIVRKFEEAWKKSRHS